MTNYERTYYEVYSGEDGKMIDVLAFLWEHESGNWVGEEMRVTLKASEYSSALLDSEQEHGTHYWNEMPVEDVADYVATFFGGEPSTHLPLRDVNEDTPVGCYWCTFEEE